MKSDSREGLIDPGQSLPDKAHQERVNSSPVKPIAIIGMACRFPGAADISEFWQLLVAGKNLVVEGPPGSVVGRSGRQFPKFDSGNSAIRFGAFIEDIDYFDAEFFRISPLEARFLDPQQRMMLETSWQALEDAAIDPDSLIGSRTGVYAGISAYDYRDVVIDSSETVDPAGGLYAVTGTALNTAIGRVSYALGLEGPSMAIDTACSSSLVAVHQAMSGLQRNETDLAIVGGVHIFLDGRPLELRANAGMLSPEGQCKTFDASADGFVCGEGCGLLVLKRLSEAEIDGDRIWGTIRGSSVNQDGASQGLTVPSGISQERAMEDALVNAGVSPFEADYLETHGTGTVVGDPIEVTAAAAVYGRERKAEHPLLIGSVKTNIGHLGPAAGIAGVIKTVLSMWHGVIPKHLNFKNPNPQIDWDRLPVRVTDVMMDWPCQEKRTPLAGINSFGWSGTNAHVVIQGYNNSKTSFTNGKLIHPVGSALPVTETSLFNMELEARETRILPLSGKSLNALKDVASGYLSWLDEFTEHCLPDSMVADSTLLDMVWTASIGRSHFKNRAGIVFRNFVGLREELENLVKGQVNTTVKRQATKVAFVFTGQASQWVGMGKNLYATEPVFRSVLEQCDQIIRKIRDVSLLDVMFGHSENNCLLHEPKWTQPAVYSLECALVALWESIGIKPSVVVGHSLGEIAAAQTANVYTLEEGLRYAAARGELMGTTRSDGAMAAIFAPHSRIGSVVAKQNAISDDVGLSIAVDNGVQQVISGPIKDVEAVLQNFESEDVKVVRLKRSPAYHSALVEPALDDLKNIFSDITLEPQPTSVPLISNITGQVLDENERMDADYWQQHAREPVLFKRSVETLAELGVDAVVEIGPHAVLGPLISMIWPESSSTGTPVIMHSLQRPSNESEEPVVDTSGGFVEAVSRAYEAGLDIKFKGMFAGEIRRRISLPSYPFQRERHWVEHSKRRKQSAHHPLLGIQLDSPREERIFESEIFPSDPAWLIDHLVYERIVAPGGLYGAMAVCASAIDGNYPVIVDDMQMHNALIFENEDSARESSDNGRKLQLLLDLPSDNSARQFEIYSKGNSDESWLLHATGKILSDGSDLVLPMSVDLDEIKANMTPWDTAQFYQMRSADEIYLGPSYHTLKALWGMPGEALGELVLRSFVDAGGMQIHPLLLDGCFQVLSVARYLTGVEQGAVYMPFGWKQLWVADEMPKRVVCHAIIRNPPLDNKTNTTSNTSPEVVTGDVLFYSTAGTPIGGLLGFTVKRATQSALLPSREGHKHLFYEVDWKKQPLNGNLPSANFLTNPSRIVSQLHRLSDYLADEGVKTSERISLLDDQERLSQAFALAALEKLGWKRKSGVTIRPDELRIQLSIIETHQRLVVRLLDILTGAGILTRKEKHFVVKIGSEIPLPDKSLKNPASFFMQLVAKHPHGINELSLLNRCGSFLAEVLTGQIDPLTLLFSDDSPSATDLYLKAPASLAANKMLQKAVAVAIRNLPTTRQLRIIEVGAGTGSATSAILQSLPLDRVEYTFTDISTGFFAEAESRFSEYDAVIHYKPLNIEKAPESQGFDLHIYDLVIAANVLHATRDIGETLNHCLDLLAPSGQLFALEGLQRRASQDLTFGLLDGWWRFADAYRPDHALASALVWRQALEDAGFTEVDFLGPENSASSESLGSSVVIARAPATIKQSPGIWVVAADESGVATNLAVELGSRNQTVILASDTGKHFDARFEKFGVGVSKVDHTRRESWQHLLSELPKNTPFRGVVHLAALDGHGADADTSEMSDDVTRAISTALALVQGVIDSELTPTVGVWFVSRGAQIQKQDLTNYVSGKLAGANLWGFGKAVSSEAPYLQPKMIDLDPSIDCIQELVDDLLYPDLETHIAYRANSRYVARLIRGDINDKRLELPDNSAWLVGIDDSKPDRMNLQTKQQPNRALNSGEVRVAIEAAGLNFAEVMISMGQVKYNREIGREFYGRVLETAHDVNGFSIGDPVVGMGFGTFATETITPTNLVSHAPSGYSASALATVPICFTTAQRAFELAELKSGDRVLIHAGAGGVGLAAIQLAQAIGAEVFATASIAKQNYVRSLGVEHVFDSRQVKFGDEILKATEGQGVEVVLNSLTGKGFIETSLSCLSLNGRFVEIAKRNIFSEEQMSAIRPDVAYYILDLDALKAENSPTAGASFTKIMKRLSTGELTPLPHTVWPLSEIRSAMEVMREARHIGKIVFRMPPLARLHLRKNCTYLVTGGMGGIGCLVARWLAERGAGTIVVNGRREPDRAANETIQELKQNGFDIRVEVADVGNIDALNEMLARIDTDLPPLAGIVHCVGVLSDGVIENQTWARFEQVLWPKVLGAWHLHKATKTKNLDFFVLFSSATGVVGSSGQTNHASANAFLDQLAAHRRGLGLPGQAIAWGAWADVGEAAEQKEKIERQLNYRGTRWIKPEQGMEAFDWVIRQDVTASTVTDTSWSDMAKEANVILPFYENLLPSKQIRKRETVDSTFSAGLLTQLRTTSMKERVSLLELFIQKELQAVLRLSTAPPMTVSFFDLGVDSLMAIQLRNRLNHELADEYTASNTVVFDYPNITALATHLSAELTKVQAEPVSTQSIESVKVQPKVHRRDNEIIAIVGMACRFPGASDLSEFWHQLEAGECAITDGRRDSGRWDGALGDPKAEKTVQRVGGFIDGLDRFDARFFNLSPIDARNMDPQQRLLLETSWHALEDAGIDATTLRGSTGGVYFGISTSEYRDLMRDCKSEIYYGNTIGATVGRVSYIFGLEGPAVPVELACASSLVSIHHAIVGLQRGETDLALAGGVNAILSNSSTSWMADLGMVSRTGKCWPFNAVADGYLRSEGCGVVVLKRLEDAEAYGDRIWGVIRGSAINQNGANGGLTMPSGPTQQRVIEEALARANVDSADIDYVEAHAIGSNIGDAIEVQAVVDAYGDGREVERPLLLGSVKANIGHLESAAGVAGLIKVILAMRNGLIPKQLNFESPNPNVNWDEIPVRITSETTPWPLAPSRPPRAGVSAFSMTGTNAHLIVEGYNETENSLLADVKYQYPVGTARPVTIPLSDSVVELPTVQEPTQRKARLLPLSGKSEEALQELAARYISWLEERIEEFSSDEIEQTVLSDLAWTASIGRSHFENRATVIFDSTSSLLEGLHAVTKRKVIPDSRDTAKVAFVYASNDMNWVGMGENVYESEPVVRAVLNHCEKVIYDQHGQSLLKTMFGHAKGLDNPEWSRQATFALQCALTALWSSIDIRPDVVMGLGAGSLAAAYAAGAVNLEQGLRIANCRDMNMKSDSELNSVNLSQEGFDNSSRGPVVVNSTTGHLVELNELLDKEYWHRQTFDSVALERGFKTLMELGVDIILELSADTMLNTQIGSAGFGSANEPRANEIGTKVPLMLSSERRMSNNGNVSTFEFVNAVATLYESGLTPNFSGLFAGEKRSRISLPGYPFQQQRFWFNEY